MLHAPLAFLKVGVLVSEEADAVRTRSSAAPIRRARRGGGDPLASRLGTSCVVPPPSASRVAGFKGGWAYSSRRRTPVRDSIVGRTATPRGGGPPESGGHL